MWDAKIQFGPTFLGWLKTTLEPDKSGLLKVNFGEQQQLHGPTQLGRTWRSPSKPQVITCWAVIDRPLKKMVVYCWVYDIDKRNLPYINGNRCWNILVGKQ